VNILKVMAITTSRADYGLLYPILRQLAVEPDIYLQVVVTGSHLSSVHGKTIDKIYQDGFENLLIVDNNIKSDTEEELCKAIATGIKISSAFLSDSSPDLMLVLGDRYELLSFCIPAMIYKIPIAHIHGGELTAGVIDDPIRHSITKMSHIHFAAMEQYANRIIQMGENPKYVFNVGAPGLDNINTIELLGIDELSTYTGIDFSKKVALTTYHPVTLDAYSNAADQMYSLLEALNLTEYTVLITMPNTDTGNQLIYESIQYFIKKNPEKYKLVKNLGQQAYLSSMKHASLMVGNSSSGIIESASFELPVVNIGDRQEGRIKPPNVVNCSPCKDDILNAISKAGSEKFKKEIGGIKNPYGDGKTAEKIVNILKSIDFENKEKLLKKGFYDLSDTSKT
jgi:UDP-hydrolysing UDP-N-acetyl-D-glucosamine 2-epimerase